MFNFSQEIVKSARSQAVAVMLSIFGILGAVPGLFWCSVNIDLIQRGNSVAGALGYIGLAGMGFGYVGLFLVPLYASSRRTSAAGSIVFWMCHVIANFAGASWAMLALVWVGSPSSQQVGAALGTALVFTVFGSLSVASLVRDLASVLKRRRPALS